MKKQTILTLSTVVLAALSFTPPGIAQSRERGKEVNKREILNGLEAGIDALRKIGRGKDAERLLVIYRGIQRGSKKDPGNAEREEAQRQLEVFGFAKDVYKETGKEKLLELIERAMHAQEIRLTGRRDKEAQQILAREPESGAQAELLAHAAHLLDERKRGPKRAHALRGIAERIATRLKRRETGEQKQRSERRREEEGERRRELQRRQEMEREQRREHEEKRRHESEEHREMERRRAHERREHERHREHQANHERRQERNRAHGKGSALERLNERVEWLQRELDKVREQMRRLQRRDM